MRKSKTAVAEGDVGTAAGARSARAAADRPRLDRERVELAALTEIDRVGWTAFSMRALAAELAVEPMSLYHWFPSKAHLFEALVDRTIRAIVVPDGAWEDRLRAGARSYRAAVTAHPGFTSYLLVHRFNTRPGLDLLERLLGIYVDAGFAPAARASAFRMFGHWLSGFCLDEAAGFAKGPSALSPPPASEMSAWPTVCALGPFNQPEHFEQLFTDGLEAMIVAHRVVLRG